MQLPTAPLRPLGLAALALSGLVAGCGGAPAPPSVVLVLVDQLRADAVPAFMPEVDALAREGVVVDGMRSAAPWTYPSVVSMFSGLYPQQHGADGTPLTGRQLSTFDERVPLLSREIGRTHYTAGFVTNPFFQEWNPFHASFHHYEVDPFIGDQGNVRGRPDLVWTADMFADHVNRRVREHFDARPVERPEFVYVHYIDVHGPWNGAPFQVADLDFKRTNAEAYRVAAGYVDGKIAELFDYFRARHGEDLVFLVTSDHGQELGDDLTVGQDQDLAAPQGVSVRGRKNTVHDFNTRIPFLVLAGPGMAAGTRVELPASNVDVLPTVLDWVGLPAPEGTRGISLLPWIRGAEVREADRQRPVYSVMSAWGRYNDCVVVDGRKLMRHLHPVERKVFLRCVFDLHEDPKEQVIASTTFGPDGRILGEAAGTDGLEFPRRFAAPENATLEAIRGLGYLEVEEDDGE